MLVSFSLFAALHRFNQDGSAVNLDHNLNVHVALFGSGWELSSLVGERCFADRVC